MIQRVLCLKEYFLLSTEDPPTECSQAGNQLQDLGYWTQGKLIPKGFWNANSASSKECGGKKPAPILACIEQPYSPPPGTKRDFYSTEARTDKTTWNIHFHDKDFGEKSQYSNQFSHTSCNNIQNVTVKGFLNWSNMYIYIFSLKRSIWNYITNLWNTEESFKEYHNKWENWILSTRIYHHLRNA